MKRWVAVAVAAVSPASSAWGQAAGPWGTARPYPSVYAEPISRAREYLLDEMRQNGVPGASVTIMKDGKVIWSEGLGYADLDPKVRATPRTQFRIFSISEMLTGAALGLLVQEGKVDLDAPVQRYVPTFPTKPYPITTRQLAGHLGGIRTSLGAEYLNQRPFSTVAEGLALFADDSLLFRPGDRYFYTSYGFTVISAVIEGVSGEPFLTFMRRRVFDPLRMQQTAPDRVDSIMPSRARWYTRDSLGEILTAPRVDNSHIWAGAGFVSTTEDLALFGSLMLDYRFLNRRTVHLLWTGQRTNHGKETGYGLGWTSAIDPTGRSVVGHDGGTSALLLVYPVERFVFAYLSNSDQPAPMFDAEVRELFFRAVPIQ